MYSSFRLGWKYLGYYLSASNGKGHGIHSPFVFRFITDILNDKKNYPAYVQVENLRSELLTDRTSIDLEDLGAGSALKTGATRTVASIARHSAKPPKFGQLLFRMVRAYQPFTVFELGTSLGLTTSYLSLGNPEAVVYTIEGAPPVAEKAITHFDKLGVSNISVITGSFEDHLIPTLNKIGRLDFGFIDGNHRREPTESYFREILPFTHNDSILVFDDIHWSMEMEKAWETIRNHERVRCSIDLFSIGIVFFRQEFREKQHITIRF